VTARPYRICLVEDDDIMGEALVDRFAVEGFECDWFRTGAAARQALERKRYDVVVSDIRLPDASGEEIFLDLRNARSEMPPYLFITGYGTIESAVRLLKMGAADYLTKPLDVGSLLEKVRALCARGRPSAGTEPSLGVSEAMRNIEAMLPRFANSTANVLLTGESGVGKEQVARALHRARDPESRTAFVSVNCGALTESLLEAELFGHTRGSFTGASRDRKGYLEQAQGGTLFLDEIGDMPLPMQVKLLRALQERRIVRVGGETEIPVDFHLICATHRDLKALVESGEFRDDLFYRIHVIEVHIPPLRDRKDDILWLADRMLEAGAAGAHAPKHTLSSAAEKALLEYPWPGNARELRNLLERACVVSTGLALTPEILFGKELPMQAGAEFDSLEEYLRSCERRYIEQSLRAKGGRIGDTAASLGISRKNLWEKMRKLKLQGSDHE
jgi:DNA-binding NtrC family response regulator